MADDIWKSFGGVRALRGAHLRFGAGEIHGLVGQNGSGKSTLLKVLSGQIVPDGGQVHIDGRRHRLGDPRQSIEAGVVTVSQETTLVPSLTVAENILLGRRLVRRFAGIDWRATDRRAEAILKQLQLEVDPRAEVGSLRPDQQQMVEIARAISMNVQVLILDEPTAALTDDGVQTLFDLVRTLRDRGVSTIFVSHRMNEIFALTDRLTVLRNGQTVATGPTSEFDAEQLVVAMTGREYTRHKASEPDLQPGRDVALRASGVSVPGRVHDISLHVAPGEIVGLTGLEGSGREDVLKAIAGLHAEAAGAVEVHGERLPELTPRAARRAGVAYIPAERKAEGLVSELSVAENLTMVATAGDARWGDPHRTEPWQRVPEIVNDYQIVTSSPSASVDTLSGGNQQKVMLAKWMSCAPAVLLLDDPTRGVDVGAKVEIYRLLESATGEGQTVLISSGEASELEALCSRVLVLFRGRLVAEVPREHISEATLTRLAMGHVDDE